MSRCEYRKEWATHLHLQPFIRFIHTGVPCLNLSLLGMMDWNRSVASSVDSVWNRADTHATSDTRQLSVNPDGTRIERMPEGAGRSRYIIESCSTG